MVEMSDEVDDADVFVIPVSIRIKEYLLPDFAAAGYICIDRDGSIWVSNLPQRLNENGQWEAQEGKDERVCILKHSHRLTEGAVEFTPIAHNMLPF